MIQDAKNRPISELFDIDSKIVYFVPKYQREYTWSKTHWEALFDDLQENEPGYFLGSLICINQSNDALSIQELEVVDGQQRLTTLSLLFAAIYKVLKDHEDELDEDQSVDLANLKRKLILKKFDDQVRVIPQIQNNNQNDYRAVLSDVGVIEVVNIAPYAGNRKIFKAFRYLKDRIEKLGNGQADTIEQIMELLDKVNQASLVKIEVGSHADAYTLFESLNNRGMPLTAIDLIKNKFLSKLESFEPGNVDYYFNHWNCLLGCLGDDYAIQERFFRQYYNAFKDILNKPFRRGEEKKKDPLGTVATRSNLIQIYEKLINYDAKDCLNKIMDAGKIYSIILSRNQDEALDGLEKPLKDLERIQGAPSYLLMLYLLVKSNELKLSYRHLSLIVQILVRFFVRRNLTDLPPTRDLTRLFMTIIDKIKDLSGNAVYDLIKDQLISVSSSDDTFRQKLEGPIYDENAGVTRFILCALAEEAMTKETLLDLWRVENKQFVWTIEHIFPQGENIPQNWINMIADGDQMKAKEIQQTHVHKLGNLTISGFNSALGNKSFEEKRDRTDRQGRSVGYKNGLKLNEDLANATSWSMEQIDTRTAKLVQQVMNIFRL